MARRTMATAWQEGHTAGVTDALTATQNALLAAYIDRVNALPLNDLDPTDLEDLVLPGLVDLHDNLSALHDLTPKEPTP